jgi:signal transduction histidine kinase
MFLDDDIAVLDSIGQAAVPHIHILLEKERQAKSMERLTHEFKVPLVAIQSAIDYLKHTEGVSELFEYDFLGDIISWIQLMRRILVNAEYFSSASGYLPIDPQPTFLMKDVIASAVRFVTIPLELRGFSPHRISYSTFDNIPKLWIDRAQFQQVVFNLLSNSIKHCYSDSDSFQVAITSKRTNNEYQIIFRDWGPGISEGMRQIIFERGIRTPEAIQRNVTGQGLGLWVVKGIVEAHDGHIELTHSSHPTEFTIFLPEYLAKQKPNNYLRERRG